MPYTIDSNNIFTITDNNNQIFTIQLLNEQQVLALIHQKSEWSNIDKVSTLSPLKHALTGNIEKVVHERLQGQHSFMLKRIPCQPIFSNKTGPKTLSSLVRIEGCRAIMAAQVVGTTTTFILNVHFPDLLNTETHIHEVPELTSIEFSNPRSLSKVILHSSKSYEYPFALSLSPTEHVLIAAYYNSNSTKRPTKESILYADQEFSQITQNIDNEIHIPEEFKTYVLQHAMKNFEIKKQKREQEQEKKREREQRDKTATVTSLAQAIPTNEHTLPTRAPIKHQTHSSFLNQSANNMHQMQQQARKASRKKQLSDLRAKAQEEGSDLTKVAGLDLPTDVEMEAGTENKRDALCFTGYVNRELRYPDFTGGITGGINRELYSPENAERLRKETLQYLISRCTGLNPKKDEFNCAKLAREVNKLLIDPSYTIPTDADTSGQSSIHIDFDYVDSKGNIKNLNISIHDWLIELHKIDPSKIVHNIEYMLQESSQIDLHKIQNVINPIKCNINLLKETLLRMPKANEHGYSVGFIILDHKEDSEHFHIINYFIDKQDNLFFIDAQMNTRSCVLTKIDHTIWNPYVFIQPTFGCAIPGGYRPYTQVKKEPTSPRTLRF